MASVRPVPAVWMAAEPRAFRDGTPAFGVALAVPLLTLWIALFVVPLAFLFDGSRALPTGELSLVLARLWPLTPLSGGPLVTGVGTLAVLVGAVVVSVCVGVPAAYAVSRHPFAGSGALPYAAVVPLLLPTPILAMALAASLQLREFQWPAWIAATALANVPLVIWRARAALHQAALLPLEEAAATCGLSPAARFVEIALPTLAPAMSVALALTTVLTLAELTLAIAFGHGWAPPTWVAAVAVVVPATVRVLCVALWMRQARRPLAATPWGIA